MGMFAFRRMREREAAALAAASATAEPQPSLDAVEEQANGRSDRRNGRGVNANSHLSLADAQSMIDGMVLSADVTAWGTATTDAKNRALVSAAQRLDRERFLGARSNDDQAMQWPCRRAQAWTLTSTPMQLGSRSGSPLITSPMKKS
jgi:hypothetical protein